MFKVIEVTQDGRAVVDTEGLFRVQVAETGEILEELCDESEAASVIGVYKGCGNTDQAQAVDYLGRVVDLSHVDISLERKKPAPTDPIEIAKQAEAERISGLMPQFKIEYDAETEFVLDKEDPKPVAEPESKGHLYYLTATEYGEFPNFGFEVCLDDRDNEGDLKQTVVDELFYWANKYQYTAHAVSQMLEREPQLEVVS